MLRFVSLSLFVFLFSGFAFAQDAVTQTKTFDDYSFDFPNATWRITSKTDEANVEAVYGDRMDGYLQIRKITVSGDTAFVDVVDREQSQKLQFLPSFVNGKEENFKGNLEGKVVNYEFTQSGKAMIGRAYFLASEDNKTIYVLRFTGLRDKLRLLRNQTDSIARTFKLKK
jgi:hypothetical protein